MGLQFARVELDANGHALHDLDPVAGGVLRGQRSEGGARPGFETFDRAVEDDAVAIQIGPQRHCLAGMHPFELGLLEVRIDPYAIERHDFEQGSAWRHVLANLYGTMRDPARDR